MAPVDGINVAKLPNKLIILKQQILKRTLCLAHVMDSFQHDCRHLPETSQELQMLSSVLINCQVTKIAMNPGSQLFDQKNLCNVVTFETLITMQTIENLNSWQSLLPDN